MKRCTQCDESKATSEFYGNTSTADGLSVICKACSLAYKREHRARLRERSDEEVEAAAAAFGPKACTRCKLVKGPDEFARDRGKVHGRSVLCLPCNAEKSAEERTKRPDLYYARRKADYGNNRQQYRSQQLKAKFGITTERYWEMHAAQGGVCAICKNPEQAIRRGRPCDLAVDHDHGTGEVRQLLCSWCNTGLGYFRDSPELLALARQYLIEHGREAVTS